MYDTGTVEPFCQYFGISLFLVWLCVSAYGMELLLLAAAETAPLHGDSIMRCWGVGEVG